MITDKVPVILIDFHEVFFDWFSDRYWHVTVTYRKIPMNEQGYI